MSNQLKRAIKLFENGKIGLCTLISNLLNLVEENFGSMRSELLANIDYLISLSNQFRHRHHPCLKNYLLILGEIGDQYPLLALSRLSKNFGYDWAGATLKRIIDEGYIDIDEGLSNILGMLEQLSEDDIGNLLLFTADLADPTKLERLTEHLAKQGSELSKYYLELFNLRRAPFKSVIKRVEEAARELIKCCGMKDRWCVLKNLSYLNFASSRVGRDKVKDVLSHQISTKLDPKSIFQLIVSKTIDPTESKSIVFFTDMFAESLDFNLVISVMERILREGLFDNVDVLGEIASRTRFINKNMLYSTVKRIRERGTRIEKEFYVSLLTHLIERGYGWAIGIIRYFCVDKWSPIRARCASTLIEHVKSTRELKIDLLRYIINSKNTKAINELITLMSQVSPDKEVLEYVIRRVSKIPRTTLANNLLNLLEKDWVRIDPKLLLGVLENLCRLSRRAKRLKERLTALVEHIKHNTSDKELVLHLQKFFQET